MHKRSQSILAIWLVSIGVGLLFLVRGAFLPYAKPLFEHLGGLSYTQIAWLVSGYALAQSVCAPIVGWYTDRTSIRLALSTSIVCGIGSFLLIAAKPGFMWSMVAVLAAGLSFVLGRIALNTLLVLHSSPEVLRRSVAKRATLLNLGSFAGNSIAYEVMLRLNYQAHAILLALLHLPLAIGLAAPRAQPVPTHEKTWGAQNVMRFLRNPGFIGDSLRRLATNLPYGCWGTIIPIYVLDHDTTGSNKAVWIISLTSVCTTLIGAHVLAVHVSAMLYRRGFKWEWWSMTSVLLYCAGLMLLMFSGSRVMLPIAIVVFICGEVLMTPCFDETAKKHSGDAAMGTCLGLLHLVDGLGRWMGTTFALALYGWMRHSGYREWYWPAAVSVFLVATSALHVVAHSLTRDGGPSDRFSGAGKAAAEPTGVGVVTEP